jgi:Carboxypeptidase regulatory-like domain
MRSVFCAGVCLTLSLFVVQPTVSAQSATTSLGGTVYDVKGAVVEGASVTLVNPTTRFTRVTKSAAQGNYQLLELPPAAYDLTVSAPGDLPTRSKPDCNCSWRARRL